MHFYSVSRKKIELDPISTSLMLDEGMPLVSAASETANRFVANAAKSFFEIGRMSGAVREAAGRARRRRERPPAVFRERKTGLIRMVYKEAVIRFRPQTSERTIAQVLKTHNYEIRSRNRFVENQFVVVQALGQKIGAEILKATNDWAMMEEVMFATPNFVSQYQREQLPAIHAEQWHLENTGRYPGQEPHEDVDARNAWKATTGSPSITVAVLDDGVDVEHPNLAPNIRTAPDPSEPRDTCGRDFFLPDDHPDHFNPRPKNFKHPYDDMPGNDIHGTPCAGVVAACGVGEGAVGIAPGCKILAVKLWHANSLAADARVADAIRYAASHADVLSCSWSGGYSADVEMALQDAGTLGRGGKGSVLVFASGNRYGGPISFPARHSESIAVGASTDKRTLASYSNVGPEQWLVAPSSGGVRAIFTTDVSFPNRGFNVGNAGAGGADGLHTNSFGGTSSSTPLVAGVVALMLSVNPRLDRAAVREILKETSMKIGSGYDSQGHSRKFGYGRVSAAAAVANASK